MLKFTSMFKNIDGAKQLDTIPVTDSNIRNYDLLMSDVIIYSFVNYWQQKGEEYYEALKKVGNTHSNIDIYEKQRMVYKQRIVYEKLKKIYNRIMDNKKLYLGTGVFGKQEAQYTSDVNYIFKHRINM